MIMSGIPSTGLSAVSVADLTLSSITSPPTTAPSKPHPPRSCSSCTSEQVQHAQREKCVCVCVCVKNLTVLSEGEDLVKKSQSPIDRLSNPFQFVGLRGDTVA